ncbi:MAG: hypothetical protein WBV06_09070, partial [Acidimicrobiia bacterium]
AKRPARRWLVPSLAIMLLLLVVGGVALFRPTPAEAALAEVAEAARAATPIDIPEGSFIYTRSERVDLAIRSGVEFGLDEESVAYLLPSIREVWRQPETEFIQIHTTNHTPTFFTPDAEDAYYRLGLDATDHLDEVQTEQLTGVTDPILEVDWPTEPDALYQALRDYAAQGGDERPKAVQVFDLATDLLREVDRTPDLRAAVVDVLARLPVDLAEQTSQAITISISYTTPAPTRDTITLSSDGQLLAETSTLLAGDPELGIPADTTILQVEYQKKRTTDEL